MHLVTDWPKEVVIQNKSTKYWTNFLELMDVVFSSRSGDFWAALGGKKEYQTSKSLQNMVKAPRLFGCSNKTGRLTVSETIRVQLVCYQGSYICFRCGTLY